MRPGIQLRDIVVGTGEEAVRGKTVAVSVRTFLLDGTELTNPGMNAARMVIDLRRRDVIAGLRYGIEGMRVGGRRELLIKPHLAYGEQGVPGQIPPNAPLRCEVDLLDVRERGVVKPADFPPGRQLVVGWLGDLQRGVAKWQFGLHEDGRCGIMVWVPIPGLKWRHSRPKHAEMSVSPERTAALIQGMIELPGRHPEMCWLTDLVYVDHSGHDGGVHRTVGTDELCVAVMVLERGQLMSTYYLPEAGAAWQGSEVRGVVNESIALAVSACNLDA